MLYNGGSTEWPNYSIWGNSSKNGGNYGNPDNGITGYAYTAYAGGG